RGLLRRSNVACPTARIGRSNSNQRKPSGSTRGAPSENPGDIIMLKLVLASIAALVTVVAGIPALAQTLEKVTAVIPQNSRSILSWTGVKDAGVFAKCGIDLTVDGRPFGGFPSAIPSKEAMATTYSGIDAILKMNEGLDLAITGGGLTVIQEIFVPKDSPIKTIADLLGKR